MEKFCSVCGNVKLEDTDYCLYCHSTEFSVEKRNFFNEYKETNKKDDNIISDKTKGYTYIIMSIIEILVAIVYEEVFFMWFGIFCLLGGILLLWNNDEKKSLNKNIEKKEFILTNDIFALASSKYFEKYVAEIIKILLNSNNIYETTKTIAEEAEGVTNEKIRREKIKYYIDNLDVEEITLENVKSILIKWEKGNVRPEIIVERLIVIFSEKYNMEKTTFKKNYAPSLINHLKEFDDVFCKNMDLLVSQSKEYRKQSNTSYNNKNITGLNYGIITNSMGSAMAYDFLNNREMSKQSRQQNYRIQDNQNLHEKSMLEVIYKQVMKEYEKFVNSIYDELEILFDLDKIKENEKKQKVFLNLSKKIVNDIKIKEKLTYEEIKESKIMTKRYTDDDLNYTLNKLVEEKVLLKKDEYYKINKRTKRYLLYMN